MPRQKATVPEQLFPPFFDDGLLALSQHLLLECLLVTMKGKIWVPFQRLFHQRKPRDPTEASVGAGDTGASPTPTASTAQAGSTTMQQVGEARVQHC